MKMKNILVVTTKERSFVDRDVEILRQKYNVHYITNKDLKKYNIKKQVKWCDLVISWFVSLHSIKPILYAWNYGKPCIGIVGGYDASDMKGFGTLDTRLHRWVSKVLYNRCNLILPVDESLEGVLANYYPHNCHKTFTLPTGYDIHHFRLLDGVRRDDNTVLTVCYVDDVNLWRKGLSNLAHVARLMHNVNFVVVGNISESAREFVDSCPPNMKFTGYVSDEELVKWYNTAKVFALLSEHEGLPNVLCEAMLCCCNPVATGVNGIPKCMGDMGTILDPYNYTPYEVVDAIKKGLRKKNSLDLRYRISNMFPIHVRESKLLKYVEDVLNGRY
jgi:glycosyltransferase involved in cell wall biosynthesis